MSSLLLKCNQLGWWKPLLSRNSIYNILPACHALQNYPVSNHCAMTQSRHRQVFTMPPRRLQNKNVNKHDENKKQDDTEYVIKLKTIDIKHQMKQLYSLYGPLFLVCHIGVGLTSLGFFCSLVWLNVDLANYIPNLFTDLVGATAAKITGSGGKFLMAYAIHKVLLPFRLMIAISLTKSLSPKVEILKNKIFGK